jgi:hypothetical protein
MTWAALFENVAGLTPRYCAPSLYVTQLRRERTHGGIVGEDAEDARPERGAALLVGAG